MKKKRVIIGISVAAVLAVCAVVLGVVFGVRAKKPTREHEYDFTAITWEWEGDEQAQARVQCACGETLILQTGITQKTILPATCEDAGRALITAKFTANGTEYSDEKQVELPALGHDFDYTAILWNWDEDALTASANIPCKRGDHTLTLTPDIDEEILLEPACESEGSALYTARLISGEQEYTDTSSRKLPALGHDYNSEFQWETDWSAATLYLVCKRECGKTHSERVKSVFSHVDATCEKNGIDTHTVRTTYDGKPFEEAHGRVIPASGHDYDYAAAEWLWDGLDVKAVVRCKRDSNHSLQIETEIQVEVLKQPACEEEGERRYTAVFQREGNSYSDGKSFIIPALGHAYAKVEFWNNDAHEVDCTRCEYHGFDAHENDDNKICTLCGVSTWLYYTDGATGSATVTVSAYSDEESGYDRSITKIVIPHRYYNNGTVASIEGLYFADCDTLESVELPEGINRISSGAFWGCASLTEINLPSTITRIDEYAFANCTLLVSNELPSGLQSIGNYAFQDCKSFTEITIPNTVMEIGGYAFNFCDKLKKVVFNGELEKLEDFVFIGCVSLTDVMLPRGLKEIGRYAFANCSSLVEINLPSTLTYIDESAFTVCTSLASIKLPSRLQSIGNHAFEDCKSLTEITIPNSVMEIRRYAFAGCSSLVEINLPSTLTLISDHAFMDCTSLEKVELPSELQSIEHHAFHGCTSLISIELPSGFQSIENYTFQSCSSLTEINLPSTLTRIGEYAFFGCASLAAIELPSGLQSIEYKAFADCNSLEEIE
ncbi:MAG: leucine-rich repeat domain-containing protein, partial [Clostridia bacterium]|nr:leucine-rich repeat domain-containing protein [Clostridia bacterium]